MKRSWGSYSGALCLTSTLYSISSLPQDTLATQAHTPCGGGEGREERRNKGERREEEKQGGGVEGELPTWSPSLALLTTTVPPLSSKWTRPPDSNATRSLFFFHNRLASTPDSTFSFYDQ